MQGHTNQYYLLFIEAKSGYCKESIKNELGSDPSDHSNVYKKIQEILEDEDGIGIDSLHTRLQLTIEKKLTPHLADQINDSLLAFGVIRDAIQGKVSSYSEDRKWVKAIRYSLLYKEYKKTVVMHSVPDEYSHIATSILELKNRKFNIQSVDGVIKINDPELLRLASSVDHRASILGRYGLLYLNKEISVKFSTRDMRFYLYRNRKILSNIQKPHPPYGYLFNLFCKYIDRNPKVKKWKLKNKFKELKELSTHLSTILDIDKMSPWENIHVSNENILEKIREWVLYPEVFYISQLSPNHGKIMFPRLFELIDGLSDSCRAEIIMTTAILQNIGNKLIQSKSVSGQFSEAEIFNLCRGFASKEEVFKALSKASLTPNLINKNYKTPFDAQRANIKEIPLIKTRAGYFVANIATYNIAIYRTLLKIALSHHPKAELKFGFAIEEFIRERLEKSKIKYKHSFEYLVPSGLKSALGVARNEGECDFIIESNDYIYLVEVKKKGITKKSWSGDTVNLLIDTTSSFMKSINQLSIAELMLLDEGRLKSKSGTEIYLEKRDIFKLVVSFEDMASLQSDGIKNNLLSAFYGIEINSDGVDESITGRINEPLLEFTKIYNELSKKGEKYTQNPFHDICYISMPQLLTILEDSKSNEDFSNNILRSNTIIYSLLDWYASYKLAKNNSLFGGNKEVFKRTTMIN